MLRCEDLQEPNKALDHLLSELKYSGATVSMCRPKPGKSFRSFVKPFFLQPETEAASEHSFHQYAPIDNKMVFVLGE